MTALPEPSRGLFDGQLHRYAVSVYYEDTDAGGIVYHANYLRWFERARTDMLGLLGIDQRRSLQAGAGAYVVAEVMMRFFAPARLGDVVMITTRVESVQKAAVRVHHLATCRDIKLTEAQIKVGFVGPDGRPLRQPQAWLDTFAPLVPVPER